MTPLPRSLDQITPQWLTEALSQICPGVTVRDVGIGNVVGGTATKIKLTPSYVTAGSAEPAPAQMWLKGGFLRHDFTFDESFVAEARFYASWAPELTINIPNCYYSAWEDGLQGLVLLEDLTQRPVTFGRATEPLSVNTQGEVVRLLAQLHARWWQSPRLNSLKSYADRAKKASGAQGKMLAREYFERCLEQDRCAAVTGKFRDHAIVNAAVLRMWQHSGDVAQCFSHGDAHLGNMFFETDGSPGFLDWQGWQKAPFMHDLCYSIIGNLRIEDRRSAEKDLLAAYLSVLADEGISEVPSFESTWHAYRRHVMHGFMWAFCPLEMQEEDIVCAEAERFAKAAHDLDTLGALDSVRH